MKTEYIYFQLYTVFKHPSGILQDLALRIIEAYVLFTIIPITTTYRSIVKFILVDQLTCTIPCLQRPAVCVTRSDIQCTEAVDTNENRRRFSTHQIHQRNRHQYIVDRHIIVW